MFWENEKQSARCQIESIFDAQLAIAEVRKRLRQLLTQEDERPGSVQIDDLPLIVSAITTSTNKRRFLNEWWKTIVPSEKREAPATMAIVTHPKRIVSAPEISPSGELEGSNISTAFALGWHALEVLGNPTVWTSNSSGEQAQHLAVLKLIHNFPASLYSLAECVSYLLLPHMQIAFDGQGYIATTNGENIRLSKDLQYNNKLEILRSVFPQTNRVSVVIGFAGAVLTQETYQAFFAMLSTIEFCNTSKGTAADTLMACFTAYHRAHRQGLLTFGSLEMELEVDMSTWSAEEYIASNPDLQSGLVIDWLEPGMEQRIIGARMITGGEALSDQNAHSTPLTTDEVRAFLAGVPPFSSIFWIEMKRKLYASLIASSTYKDSAYPVGDLLRDLDETCSELEQRSQC